jgi:hypothetical protein
MISICIPIYDFNVTGLVSTLSLQSKSVDVPVEIILIDDGSNMEFREVNENVCKHHVYIPLNNNIGRAAIRNLFLNYAKYPYLLFLDCDVIIHSDDFLSNYIESIQIESNQIAYGGRIYSMSPPERNQMLRWKYGVKKESKPVIYRNQNPNKSFMTNNFIIEKELFDTIKFDERLVGYGHEDTLFGFELKKRNIKIIHIDNPVMDGDLEENGDYLQSNEKAISNLIRILEITNYDKDFINDVALLRIYYKLYGVRTLIKIVFIILKPILKWSLSSGYLNLYIFDFYKLGTLAAKMDKKNQNEIDHIK